MLPLTDFGGFLVCCQADHPGMYGSEKNSVAICLITNHRLTGLNDAVRLAIGSREGCAKNSILLKGVAHYGRWIVLSSLSRSC